MSYILTIYNKRSTLKNVKMLADVASQKQFMDQLDAMNKQEYEDPEAGRNRDLKSYIIEANKPLEPQYVIDDIFLEIKNASLDHIKILTATKSKQTVQYYLDQSDTRFLVLHTNDKVQNADHVIEKIVTSNTHSFDSAWLHTDMLKTIASNFGNKSLGYGIRYNDIFKTNDNAIDPRNDLKMEIMGTISNRILELLQNDGDVNRTMGYEKISFNRGSADDGVLENLRYDGRFRLVKGDSVDEHVSVIDQVTEKYRDLIELIEKERIRVEKKDELFAIEGNAFIFEFTRQIDDWNKFLPKIFDANKPFRIWGLRVDTDDNRHKILCIDMHTGDQLDVEVDQNIMRVYLPDKACGNVILRLYTNLQRYVDANMRCEQLKV